MKTLFAVLAGASLCLAAPSISPADGGKPSPVEKKEVKAPVVGDMFPELTGKTYDGVSLKLSDYKGKVVLVDFWATWCPPCRLELPTVRMVYDRFHDAGFEVMGVSLDRSIDDLKAWQENPEKALPWKSVVEGKEWESSWVSEFGIRGIPAPFLLDQTGKVVAADEGARGANLLNAVGGLLDKSFAPMPKLSDLMKNWSSSADPEQRAKTASQMAQLAEMFQGDALDVAAEYLDGEKANPTPEGGKLMAEMMMPSVKAGKEIDPMDAAALGLYYAGNAAEAAEVQEKTVETLRAKLVKRNGEEKAAAMMKRPGIADYSIRLALYRAAKGDMDGAKKAAAAFESEGKPDPKVAESKYYAMLEKKMAVATKAGDAPAGLAAPKP